MNAMNVRRRMRKALLAASCTLLIAAPALAADPVKVGTSIKPIHSLVAGVMQGVAEPVLLVRGAASPHSFSLRPSDARALNGADLVFWVGEDLETFLTKPIESLGGKARAVALMDEAKLKLLPTREGGAWEAHEDEEAHEEAHGHEHGVHDAHVWLDVGNTRKMVATIVEELAEHDAANAARYRANGAALSERLTALDAELGSALAPVKGRPFVVFHDAYHYLEARYGLAAVGAITVSPEQRPSAQRLSEIRRKIDEVGAACVFAEPQFEPTLVDTVIEGTNAQTGVLDPLGAALEAGPHQYFQLLNSLADSLVHCLGAAKSG